MTKYFSILFLMLPIVLKAQNVTVVKHSYTVNHKAIDVEPQFKGGSKAFYDYITSNVEYDPTLNSKVLQGKVTVSMAIEKDGSISDVKIIKGFSDVIDRETLRVINSSPKWKPGMQGGSPIKVRYTFSINYAFTTAKN